MTSGIRLVCVRHAPVAVSGVCYGQSDVPVTLDADDAAAGVDAALGGLDVDVVWASPWARARCVAERLAVRRARPLRIDARLAELSMGIWEGMRFADLERDPRFGAWMEAWQTDAPPGGETVAVLCARVASWLDDLRRVTGGARHVAICHAGVIRAIRAHARGVPYAHVVSEAVPHLVPEGIEIA